MAAITNHCAFCTRKAACFKFLSKKELELINENKTTIAYKKGETIIKQGTQFTQVISFNAGIAKFSIEVDDKRNLMLGIIQPSEILGGPGMFSDNKYAFTVTALIDSLICQIDVQAFRQVFKSNDQFAESFLSSFSFRYIDTFKRFVTLTKKQMHGRLADALIFFAESVYNSDTFELQLSRQELADFTGMSKESVSRIMNEFTRDKIINTKGRYIEICDKYFLKRINEAG